ncbi:hypothetical protein IAT38_000750 [Cryptococcus sp. DSM 104549]
MIQETERGAQQGRWDIQVASGNPHYAKNEPGEEGLRFVRQDMKTGEMWEDVGDGIEERWEQLEEGERMLEEGEREVGGEKSEEVNHRLSRELAAMSFTTLAEFPAEEDFFLQEQNELGLPQGEQSFENLSFDLGAPLVLDVNGQWYDVQSFRQMVRML